MENDLDKLRNKTNKYIALTTVSTTLFFLSTYALDKLTVPYQDLIFQATGFGMILSSGSAGINMTKLLDLKYNTNSVAYEKKNNTKNKRGNK